VSNQIEKYAHSLTARRDLQAWYKTPLGQALLKAENKELESVLPELFGYHLLQLGEHNGSSYLESSPIRHQVVSESYDNHDQGYSSIVMNAHNLGISSDSIDTVVLPHTLDLDLYPHQVLREADRVLVPEGRAVILNFNPWSTWGVRHIPNIWHGECPYSLRFLSPMRIKDWLVLLGFEIESVKTFFYRLPISNPTLLNKLAFVDKIGEKFWPAFGCVYLIVAKKQVSTLTPVRPRWFLRRRSRVLPGFIETRNE